MAVVTGVVFRRPGKLYYFNPGKVSLEKREKVVVKTARGVEVGEVLFPPGEVPEEEVTRPLKKIMRKANEDDLVQLDENKEKEEEAFKIAQEKIAKHDLPMRLVEVEVLFDRSKIIFYFTAENRVDFRELVKDLAAVFKKRIELRQIGVRDKAKMVGGFGPCGCRLCCTVFLSDFDPVSIRMAKEQDLPLNPLKISGVCGRLMCCLRYEFEAYKDFKRRVPKKGSVVQTAEGVTGKVVDFNVLREYVTLEDEEGYKFEIPAAEVRCTCGVTEEGAEEEEALALELEEGTEGLDEEEIIEELEKEDITEITEES